MVEKKQIKIRERERERERENLFAKLNSNKTWYITQYTVAGYQRSIGLSMLAAYDKMKFNTVIVNIINKMRVQAKQGAKKSHYSKDCNK